MLDQRKPSLVSAVLFDYGLVLSAAPDSQAWERMKQIFHADETAFHAAYWRPRHPYDRGDITGQAYWDEVAIDLGHPLTNEERTELLAADIDLWTQPNDAMITWAGQLQAAGMRTGILSNLGDCMEGGILERCGWLNGFDHHTFSHRLGIAKPEAAIYAYAAEGLQTPPAQVLFIDDRADNIQAAEDAGMQAVRYLDHQQFVEEMQRRGFGELLTPAAKV